MKICELLQKWQTHGHDDYRNLIFYIKQVKLDWGWKLYKQIQKSFRWLDVSYMVCYVIIWTDLQYHKKVGTSKNYRSNRIILFSCNKYEFLCNMISCVNGPASLGGERFNALSLAYSWTSMDSGCL